MKNVGVIPTPKVAIHSEVNNMNEPPLVHRPQP